MPITPQQIQAAGRQQQRAAHDPSPQVRVIAGPGTGKSHTIQERVLWLLQNGTSPDTVYVVSFTRASSRDLRDRIRRHCEENGEPGGARVSVSTLHSLALRALRAAGLLVYPTDPLVLDNWELQNLHDLEFSSASGFRSGSPGAGYTPARARLIRNDYEAFCGTGVWQPAGYALPVPPISAAERQAYEGFHRPRTQLYAYVLPGEIVRQCVENMSAGVLDPAALLNMRHLVVDEYQDLNPSDLAFVDGVIRAGVIVLVAGDDDQSLYSFRYASPAGIQSFTARHHYASTHQLSDCFRSTPNILTAAQALICAFPGPARIPKRVSSLYANAVPPEPGVLHCWRFQSGTSEADCIARSCAELIAAGIAAREIMILLSNTRAILPTITQALGQRAIPYLSPRAESFFDSRAGRYLFSLLRIACDHDDYVAHRTLLGLRPRVGPGTCNAIAQLAIAWNLNFRDIFYRPLPPGVFSGRALTAINAARATCASVLNWQADDAFGTHAADIYATACATFGENEADQWQAFVAHLPDDMSLLEVRDYLWADNDEQKAAIVEGVYERLGLVQPPEGFLPPQVRIMTMHGCKGLSARVVFIPALEEDVLPGPHRTPYPGLVLEAARMLYVSMTRARAACILSYADARVAYGVFSRRVPSRFVPHLGKPFVVRATALSAQEVRDIVQSCYRLF